MVRLITAMGLAMKGAAEGPEDDTDLMPSVSALEGGMELCARRQDTFKAGDISKGRTAPATPSPPEAAPAHPAAVPVQFVVVDRTRLTRISAGGQTCVLPCRLWLPQGDNAVFGFGDTSLATRLMVPAGGARVQILRRGSGPLRMTGAALVPAGMVAAVTTWTIALACPPGNRACVVAGIVGGPVLAAGAFVTGIYLLVQASRLQPTLDVIPAADSRLRLTALGVDPSMTGVSLSASLSF